MNEENKIKVSFNAKTASHEEVVERIAQQNRLPYEIGRGLHTMVREDAEVLGYNESLPSFQGRTLQQIIEEKLRRHKTSNILDIGYGRGMFLLDVTEKYPEIRATGFGRSEFTQVRNETLKLEPTHLLLTSHQNITLVEGMLPNMVEITSDSQDIIVVNNVFQYLTVEARIESLKEIYRALKKDGIALISRIDLEDEQIKLLMSDLGVSAGGYEIASSEHADIQKTFAFRK